MTDTHIKIKPVTPRVQYTANGSTTVFPYSFAIFDETDMVVYVDDDVIATGYTVSGAGQTDGGNVTFDSAPEDGKKITLLRNVPIERMTDFQEGGTFRPKNINDEFDRQTAFVQQVQEILDRAVKVGPTSDVDPEEVLSQVERVYGSIDNVDAVADDLTNVDAVAGDLTNIDAVASDLTNIDSVANDLTNIDAVNANKTNINAVAGNATNINAVAGNQTNINAVAGNATNINAVAGNSTNINAVAGNATNINAVAGNESDIDTVAGISSAVSTVAGNNANVTTVATNISDVNSCATNMSAIQDAPNQASSAALSAQQAAISAAGTKFKLFHHDWFDYELNDMAWLRADTFSWQDGTVYTSAYNHLVDDIDGISTTTETIGSYTITYYPCNDGHKIVAANQEATVANIYNESGVAWYYILDTTNQRFKLPRENPAREELINTGKIVSTGSAVRISPLGENANYVMYQKQNSSQFYLSMTSTAGNPYATATQVKFSEQASDIGLETDLKNSTSIYKGKQYLYFYVGQFSQSAIEQTAGLNAELFNGKVDIDGGNVIASGGPNLRNISKWSSNTTNCITDIPQDIKLELNNGTLTLKAGSKVYVPNGSGVFDVVTLASDVSRSTFGTQDGSNCIIEGIYSGGNITAISWSMPTNTASGTTAPTSSVYYKTDTNYINSYSGGSAVDQRSFPIALVTMSSGTVTSIDQIFNGFGYIGSTVFALPGVKGLIPNGRNADGSLKNIEITLNSVKTHTISGQANWSFVINNNGNLSDYYSFASSETQPSGNYILWYKQSENIQYTTSTGTPTIVAGSYVFDVSSDSSGKITSFTPKTVFHAVDYNDLVEALNNKIQQVSVLPASPTSDVLYVIPE